MKRLCFLSPDVAHAGAAVAALREVGLPDRHLYVVARQDIDIGELPDAGPESDDFLPAYERGLAVGGVGGPLAGLLVMSFPSAGVAVGGGALLPVTLFGAGFGGPLTGMADAALPSSRLEQFQREIDAGAVPIMADVDAETAVAAREQTVRRLGADIGIRGFVPPAPIIP